MISVDGRADPLVLAECGGQRVQDRARMLADAAIVPIVIVALVAVLPIIMNLWLEKADCCDLAG